MRKFENLDKKEAVGILFRSAYKISHMNMWEALESLDRMLSRVDRWNTFHHGEKILLTEMGVADNGNPFFWLEGDYFELDLDTIEMEVA